MTAKTITTISLITLVTLALGCSVPMVNRSTSPTTLQGCLVPGAWHRLEHGRPVAVSGVSVLERAAGENVVLLGEYHTNRDDHRWQLQTLAALHLLHPDMVIGFESFPRRLQPVLDKWVAGRLSVEQFLQQSEWKKVWDYPADLYLPLFQFARINRIPMAALNVDISLPRAVREYGWQAIPTADKEGVSRPAAPPQAYIDMLYKTYKEHVSLHDGTTINRTDPRFRHFVQAQTVWDRAMAEALAKQLTTAEKGNQPLVVGIMGAGHVRNSYGVPFQLRDLGIHKVTSLLPVKGQHGCEPFTPGYANAVFALPAHAPNGG